MELSEKIEAIQSLKEDALRENVLIPLFSKMGFIDPISHHHNNEKGKDIIVKDYDSKFKKTSYLAVVVKAGDVTGSASGNSNYFTLLNQVKQSLNEPYKHIYELREVVIDQVIIVISGRFLPTSLESIYGTLKQERLDKAIKETIDITRLIDLIDDHFAEYWSEIRDSKESIKLQRDQLLNNVSKLCKVLFNDVKSEQSVLQQVSANELKLELFPFQSTIKYSANIGYYKIEIDEIDEFFVDTPLHNDYAEIKKYTFELKKRAQRILYDFEEPINILKKILEEKNPEKICDLIEEVSDHINRSGTLGISSHDIENQDEFNTSIREYKQKKEFLASKDLVQFFTEIYNAIEDEAIKFLTSIYKNYATPTTSNWIKLNLKISLLKRKIYHIEFSDYIQEPRFETDKWQSKYLISQEKNVDEIGEVYFIAHTLPSFKHSHTEYNPEQKAKSITWLFTKDFEELLFEHLGYDDI